MNTQATEWRLMRSGLCDWALNMAVDECMLQEAFRLQQPILRFYGWKEPAASFGYFQKYAEVEQLTLLRPLVRRPTGGGIVPHDSDWTYSLAFPSGHEWYNLSARESYCRIHVWVANAFRALSIDCEVAAQGRKSAPGQCFVGWEESDVLWSGRKIAGAAQRRTRLGLLIQGSVQPPPLALQRESWETAMLTNGDGATIHWFEAVENDATWLTAAEGLAQEKYSAAEYNRKR